MMLENKVALVTGGTSGIGRATAVAFGAAGAKVVFSGRRDAEGEATAALIRDVGAECLFVRSDVSSEADVQALVEKEIADIALQVGFSSQSHLTQQFKRFTEMTPKQFANTIRI